MTDTDAKRIDRLAAVTAAWAELALNKSFKVVFEDAQLRFGMLSPSFVATDGYNTHAAAVRDGQKEVLRDFARRLCLGRERLEDETTPQKPTQAA